MYKRTIIALVCCFSLSGCFHMTRAVCDHIDGDTKTVAVEKEGRTYYHTVDDPNYIAAIFLPACICIDVIMAPFIAIVECDLL